MRAVKVLIQCASGPVDEQCVVTLRGRAMDGVQIAQQDSLRIASRCAGCMTAADDALLDLVSRRIRIRGTEIQCETTATSTKSAAGATPSASSSNPQPTTPTLSNLRTLGGDWRASM